MKPINARLPVAGHYIQKRLVLAGFARRLAGFAIILMVVSVLIYRLGSISPQALIGLLLLAGVIGFIALLVALWGMGRAWFQGVAGGGTAVGAFVLSAIALSPFAFAGYLAADNPPVNTAVTQRLAPDDVAAVIDAINPGADQATASARAGSAEAGATAESVLASQPSVVPGRRYLADAPRVYRAARDVLEDDLDWDVDDVVAGDPNAVDAPAAPQPAPGDLGVSGSGGIPIPTPRAQIETMQGQDPEQILESDQYRLTVVARDAIFALPSDMVIRIAEDGDETFVDVQSTSRDTGLDLGQNRRFIERFLTDLDTAMSGLETLDTGG